MLETVFHTDDLPAGTGADAYVEGLSRLHSPLSVVGSVDETFRAYKRIVELGKVSLYATGLDSLTIRRTPRLIRQSDPESYDLSLISGGTVGLTIGDSDSVHGPLGLRTSDSSRPYELRVGTHGERVEAICVGVPKAVLPLPSAMADRIIGRPLDGRSGIGALFAGFLTTLVANARAYTAADVPRLETVVTDLLATLFAHELDTLDALPPETRHHTLRLRIRSFIQQRLGYPGLTPDIIAAAHHISVSYLHRIFQEEAQTEGGSGTVMGYIRQQRLERARRDLADSAQRTRPVQEIAHRWGFTHHATFTRAFRARYHMTPTEYRHACGVH
ncbi:AraC family transcriptional regulator [Streptomyces malaysiensis]